jgi:DNA processing protein
VNAIAHADTSLPDEAYAAALASLPGCGPARLMRLVEQPRALADIWVDVSNGRVVRDANLMRALAPNADTLVSGWRAASSRIDVRAAWGRLVAEDVRVMVFGRDGYPHALADDPEPPAVVFASVGADVLQRDEARPRAAIVGTRRCTGYGADVARELGRELTRAGVAIVSGLAAGIDGAAHEGALVAVREAGERDNVARPVAVVGSGLDVVYPRRHRRLWQDLIDHGVVLTEAPLGAAPEPWRFPLRNRIIAALGDVVIVVESHVKGGSMHTVHAAIDRARPVMAVPGSIHSPASAGTNRLLADGIPPVLDVQDVLVALSLAAPTGQRPEKAPPTLDPMEERVLAAVDWSPTATEAILRRSGAELGAAAAALARLEMAGLVRNNAGWWERSGEHR